MHRPPRTVSCIMENAAPENSFRTVVSTYEVKEDKRCGTYMLPRLCNHCANPPLHPRLSRGRHFPAQGWRRRRRWRPLRGCAYCVQACPYDARFINHETGKADKCTFCAHRVDEGLLPACVETCVGGARIFGDLNDPHSVVHQLLTENKVKVLRPEQGTQPHVFYGTDTRFAGHVEGEATLWQPSKHGK
jgi:tetrathionate reductase subunit B